MPSIIQSIIVNGSQGTIVDIECHLSNNLPNIIIVGFANKAVDEARERIRGAFATSRIVLPRKRVTINLAPADVPKADSGFDLAIAVAILQADDQLIVPLGQQQAFIGELGLDGRTRGVRGIIGKVLLGRAKGITTFYIARANLAQAQLVPHVTLVPIDNLSQLYLHLHHAQPLPTVPTGSGQYPESTLLASATVHLSEIVGQDLAKRALEVAAAGGHNIFFNGPPGTGKSMLAKALAGILPPLTQEEILEVTHLHSLASHDYEAIITERPFRAPHHSASFFAITGGGPHFRPGEISLAHRGVLFFDELPEFDRDTLEALRQPLEDRTISIARAHGRADYPANFMLVATGNPCPCGYYGIKGRTCKCGTQSLRAYQGRLSGPILDRIDLACSVSEVHHEKLLTQPIDPIADNKTRQLIIQARAKQAERFGTASKLNADMTNQDIKSFARLTSKAIAALNESARGYNLSARAYMRTIKVARTVADLHTSDKITEGHITEALQLRPKPAEEPKS